MEYKYSKKNDNFKKVEMLPTTVNKFKLKY